MSTNEGFQGIQNITPFFTAKSNIIPWEILYCSFLFFALMRNYLVVTYNDLIFILFVISMPFEHWMTLLIRVVTR